MLQRGCIFYFIFVTHALASNDVGNFMFGNDLFITGKDNKTPNTRAGDSWFDWINDIMSAKVQQKFTRRSQLTKGEDCARKCDGSAPRICFFQFFVERYSILGPACGNCSNGVMQDCYAPQCVIADGFQRGIIVANRQLPGPSIQVCVNDLIVVEVINLLGDAATSIHWHGMKQRNTPHMDGVPMVTQCPITPSTNFTYVFEADEAGTNFWHSHIGAQKLDGLTGPLIIRDEKRKEIHKALYDEDRPDHVIFIQDWTHLTGDQYVPGIHNETISQLPDAVLINGLGRLSFDGSNEIVPVANFTVESGKRYRFRLIGGTCLTCAYALKIQSHKLIAISGDYGFDFKPTPVDSIGINSADRFDFILEANQTSGSYYIYVQSLNSFCRDLRQIGVLHYVSSGSVSNSQLNLKNPPPTGSIGTILNHPNSTCSGTNTSEICVSMLKGENNAPNVKATNPPYYQYHVTFGSYHYEPEQIFAPGRYPRYEEAVYPELAQYLANNISFKLPPSPMLTQWEDIPPSAICGPECYRSDRETPCMCANVYQVPLGSLVDIIIIDSGERDGFDHPFHIHGYSGYVMEMGLFSPNIEERPRELKEISLRARNNKINFRSRPQKDTISVPARGYVVLRFIADNPGYWLIHCHFLFHLESGMALVFRVGTKKDMAPPPRYFPKCGNFYGYT